MHRRCLASVTHGGVWQYGSVSINANQIHDQGGTSDRDDCNYCLLLLLQLLQDAVHALVQVVQQSAILIVVVVVPPNDATLRVHRSTGRLTGGDHAAGSSIVRRTADAAAPHIQRQNHAVAAAAAVAHATTFILFCSLGAALLESLHVAALHSSFLVVLSKDFFWWASQFMAKWIHTQSAASFFGAPHTQNSHDTRHWFFARSTRTLLLLRRTFLSATTAFLLWVVVRSFPSAGRPTLSSSKSMTSS